MALIWWDKNFDEYMDGIVYASFIGLGFACVENIMYVFSASAESFQTGIGTSITRALLSVPAHFLFGVVLGYFLSLAKFQKEKRNQEDPVSHQFYTTAKVSLLIACSSTKEWSNEQRKVYSFENVLRPIYKRLMEVLERDRRLDWGYGGKIPHEYSENYSYGRYGAYTDANGNAVSEPIDAINIVNLQVKVKIQNCIRK